MSKTEAIQPLNVRPLVRRRGSRFLRQTLVAAAMALSAAVATGQGVSTSVSSSVQPASLQRRGEPVHTDVRASSFQKVTPGKTSRSELIEAQGEPIREEGQGADAILTYQLGPFPRVEMILSNDIVDSIVVHLASPAAPAAIARELGLTSFIPATIFGDGGEVLGQVYPERAVAFSFEEGSDPARVSQLVLEPIAAEFFLLRAKNDAHLEYSRSIADLNYYLQSDPQNDGGAHSLKARIYTAVGHFRSALKSSEAALQQNPDKIEYRLQRAKVKFLLGQHRAAALEAKAALQQSSSDFDRANAEALLGDLLANGPEREYQEAMDHHLAAIKLAAPLAASEQVLERRAAKRLLVEIHLAIANDITHGNWSGKEESAPKWLRIAKDLADQLVNEDGGDEAVQLLLLQKALASYVGMRGRVDPTDVVRASLKLGNRLVSESDDSLRKRALQWLMVDAIREAVRVEQMRGEGESITDLVAQMDALMRQLENSEESTARSDLARGQVYFLAGSTFAVQLGDHTTAVRWFERAMPFLMKVRPAAASSDLIRHGQRFVSMGVSYWEQNARNEAIRLTESGLQVMQSAIEGGGLDPTPLAVAFSNLSAMYADTGRSEDASRFAEKAAQLEASVETTQNR